MTIRWKVVRPDRRSFIVSPDSKYSLVYIKGTIVEENKKGFGIMCFETEEQAKVFASHSYYYKIIKVRGIGRGRKVKLVARIFKNSMLEYYIQNFFDKLTHPRKVPKGTMCYKSVEVLT